MRASKKGCRPRPGRSSGDSILSHDNVTTLICLVACFAFLGLVTTPNSMSDHAANLAPHARRLLAQAEFTPEDGEYANNSFKFLGIIAGAAVLGFIAGWVLICCKCCCSKSPQESSDRGAKMFSFFSVFVIVTVSIGLIVGMLGNADTSSGSKDLMNEFLTIVDETAQFGRTLRDEVLPPSSSSQTQALTDMINNMDDIKEQVRDIQSVNNNIIDPARSGLTASGCVLGLLGAGLLVTAMITKKGTCATVALVVFTFTILLTLLACAIHLVLHTTSQHICTDMDSLIAGNLLPSSSGAESTLLQVSKCPQASNDIQTDAQDRAIANMQSLNGFGSINTALLRSRGDAFIAEAEATITRLDTYIANQGPSSNNGQVAALAKRQLDAAIQLDKYSTRAGQQTCPYVKDLFRRLQPFLCDKYSGGSQKVTAGTGLVGFCALIIGLIVSYKGNAVLTPAQKYDPNSMAMQPYNTAAPGAYPPPALNPYGQPGPGGPYDGGAGDQWAGQEEQGNYGYNYNDPNGNHYNYSDYGGYSSYGYDSSSGDDYPKKR
eukprot:TRINITY_DN707_c0_g1_i8.p1 TRINITY_DN707_c0_g1~~TRINITY_DN707_c0_g1_i8.p1  ORF type:complete len:547 (-),score=83.04 TRINITY_DN707_c0_g1_i8:145-1785(-)